MILIPTAEPAKDWRPLLWDIIEKANAALTPPRETPGARSNARAPGVVETDND